MPSDNALILPWYFAANHWLSRSLQALWAVAIALNIWAVKTGRTDPPPFLIYAVGLTFLAWAVHIVWQVVRRRSGKLSAPDSASNKPPERTRGS